MSRTIDVHTHNERRTIEPDPARPRDIEAVVGVGVHRRAARQV